MKAWLLSGVLFTLTACGNTPTNDKLQALWADVVTSQNVAEERQAVTSLKAFTKKQDVTYFITITDAKGNEKQLNEFDGKSDIASVQIRFEFDNSSYTGPTWIPASQDNFYTLLQE